MKQHHFNAFGTEYITVEFDCKVCKNPIIAEGLGVPGRERLERIEDSDDIYVKNDESIYCGECDTNYNLEIWVTDGDAHVVILELKKEDFIHISEKGSPPDFYPFLTENELEHFLAIESNQKFFDTFNSEIENLRELINIELGNVRLKPTLLKQIYIATITAMETFLGDTFIILTLESEENLKRFVRFFPAYEKTNFTLSQIFEKYDTIREIAKSSMLDIIFHNLSKVRTMYSKTFDIDFPSIAEPSKCVAIRHDLVHRNGKSKEGAYAILRIQNVSDAIDIIDSFIKELAYKLYIKGGCKDQRLYLDNYNKEDFERYNDFMSANEDLDDLPF